jgi:undecaprenyl-diphosphatase
MTLWHRVGSRREPHGPRTRCALAALLAAIVLGVAGSAAAAPAGSGESQSSTNVAGLSWADGLALGVVEGITEYLPISSTGHLVVTERFLDLDPPKGEARDALDSYTVVIQLGAILAVLLLYRRRVRQIVSGVVGHSVTGRRLLIAIIVAFVPVGIVAKALEDPISDHLLSPGPVAIAWLVGGVGLLVGAKWLRDRGRIGRPLEELTVRHAAIIGAMQVFSLWPGVSRSLTTIVGGVAAGLTIGAAVEFSFLLGLATLSAATLYELVTNGSGIVDRLGIGAPLVGIAAAFVSAAAAINLFVEYLNRRDLRIFGVYRVLAAGVVFALLLSNTI